MIIDISKLFLDKLSKAVDSEIEHHRITKQDRRSKKKFILKYKREARKIIDNIIGNLIYNPDEIDDEF